MYQRWRQSKIPCRIPGGKSYRVFLIGLVETPAAGRRKKFFRGVLDFGFWILDFGFWILDFGFWILEFRDLTF